MLFGVSGLAGSSLVIIVWMDCTEYVCMVLFAHGMFEGFGGLLYCVVFCFVRLSLEEMKLA